MAPDAGTEAGIRRAVECLLRDRRNRWCAYAVAKQLALAGKFEGLDAASARELHRRTCAGAPEGTVERGWLEFEASDWWRRRIAPG